MEDHLRGGTRPRDGQGRLVASRRGSALEACHVEAVRGRARIGCAADDDLLDLLPVRRGDAEGAVLVHADMVRIRGDRVGGRRVLVVFNLHTLGRGGEAGAVGAIRRRRPALGVRIRREGHRTAARGITATAARRAAIVQRVEVRLAGNGFRRIALVVHQLAADNDLVADLDVGLAGLELLVPEIQDPEAVELLRLRAVVGNVEGSITIGAALGESAAGGNTGNLALHVHVVRAVVFRVGSHRRHRRRCSCSSGRPGCCRPPAGYR